MTIERCLSLAYKYQYAGVEYGRECWVGNTLNVNGNGDGSENNKGVTRGMNLTDDKCSSKCPGNSSEFCGAGGKLSLYWLDYEKM